MFNLRAFRLKFSLMLLSGIALGCSSCACNDDYCDDPTPTPNNDDLVELTLDINFGSMNGSRARDVAVDDESGVGTLAENYINPDAIHVYLSKSGADDNFGGRISEELDVQSLVRTSSTTYRVRGKVSAVPTSTYFWIAVTANYQYTPQFLTNNSLFAMNAGAGGEYQYHYGEKYKEANGGVDVYYDPEVTPIPMFGSKRYTSSDFYGHSKINVGTITMIRGMTKLVVKSSEGDQIESATLRQSFDVGMCGPVDVSPGDLWTDTGARDLETITIANVPRRETSRYGTGYNGLNPLSITTDLPFKNYGNNVFVIYIPPYINTSKVTAAGTLPYADDSCTNYITLKMVDRENTYTINFTEYGSAYDLYRNYMYIYDVGFDHLQLKYSVEAIDNFFPANISFD